ncbi:Hypothetical protein XFF4834R_chr14350 [Xanthomonas citri pv. fuscans]|nr:Hypothetical protein XFF4834R_chr14350 [Xanthomonas citri pv. fuscans]
MAGGLNGNPVRVSPWRTAIPELPPQRWARSDAAIRHCAVAWEGAASEAPASTRKPGDRPEGLTRHAVGVALLV